MARAVASFRPPEAEAGSGGRPPLTLFGHEAMLSRTGTKRVRTGFDWAVGCWYSGRAVD